MTNRSSTPGLFAGRYDLQGELGRGGMGVVFRARDMLVGDVVALKRLELGHASSREMTDRFCSEVRLARKISHPNVARMHDLAEVDGMLFLTMEYVEGRDLAAVLAGDPLTPRRCAEIGLGVAEGLAAAHAAGVVHRDLKPANVMLGADGRVVITDFGIASALAGDELDWAGQVIGTPLYMAPEQLLGQPVDPRSDVYALGLILHEALTGARAFEFVMDRLTRDLVDPRGAGAPAQLAELVLRCAARGRDARPSAREVADLLRRWLAQPDAAAAPVRARVVARVPAAFAETAIEAGPVAQTVDPQADAAVLFHDDVAIATLHAADGFVRLARNSRPLPELPEVRRRLMVLIDRLDALPREQLALLSDMRGTVGRGDEGFEALLSEFRPRLFARFRRIALLVRSAAGRLQGQRFARSDRLSDRMLITREEAEALAFVRRRPA